MISIFDKMFKNTHVVESIIEQLETSLSPSAMQIRIFAQKKVIETQYDSERYDVESNTPNRVIR